jgi:hypothetical protein
MEDWLAPQRLNSCCRTCNLIALDACGPSLTRHVFCHASPFNAVGMVDACYRLQQSPAIILGHSFEHTPVGGNRFEQLDGISKTRRKRPRWNFSGGHQLSVTQSEGRWFASEWACRAVTRSRDTPRSRVSNAI